MIKILQIKFSGILGQINGVYILKKKSDYNIRRLFKQNFTSNFTISPDFIVLFFVIGILNCAFVISFFSFFNVFFFLHGHHDQTQNQTEQDNQTTKTTDQMTSTCAQCITCT